MDKNEYGVRYGFHCIDQELLDNMKKHSPGVINKPGTVYLGPLMIKTGDEQILPMYIPAGSCLTEGNIPKSDLNAPVKIMTDLYTDQAIPVTEASFVLPCAADIPDNVKSFYMTHKELVAELLQESYDLNVRSRG